MDNVTLSDIIPELGERHDSGDFEHSGEWVSLLNLTYAVWRVVDAAVENDFLKSRIKQAAADILAKYPNAAHHERVRALLEEIQTTRALLSLAQRLSSAREVNFMVLKNEYKKVSAGLARRLSAEKSLPPEKVVAEDITPVQEPVKSEGRVSSPAARQESGPVLSDRQEKILLFFQKKKDEKVKLKEVMQFFPGLTDRTIRNDLRDLCLKKFLARSNGHGQASFYKLAPLPK